MEEGEGDRESGESLSESSSHEKCTRPDALKELRAKVGLSRADSMIISFS